MSWTTLPGSRKVFFLVDCTCFYVSCEVLRDPSLRGKCVCVGGDIVLASSYEARAYGVKTGTPIWDAADALGRRLVHLDPDFTYYRKVSSELMSWMSARAPSVEPYSVDEAFADVTGLAGTVDGYMRLADSWKSGVLREVGVPVSVGCSNTRLKAKAFAEVNKPAGTYVGLTPARESAVWTETPVGDFPYVGPASAEKIRHMAPTVAAFAAMDPREVRRKLGSPGLAVWLELKGYSAWAPEPPGTAPKSISRTRSFNHELCFSEEPLLRRLSLNAERAWEELCASGMCVSRVSVSLRTKGFQVLSAGAELAAPTSSRPEIWEAARAAFAAAYKDGETYRGTGVWLSGLTKDVPRQLGMGERGSARSAERQARLSAAFESINRRFGRFTVAWGDAALAGAREGRGLSMPMMEA